MNSASQTYKVHHLTKYKYSQMVTGSRHAAAIRPANLSYQTCHSFDLKIHPRCFDLRERRDYFGNHLSLFSLDAPHDVLIIEALSKVTVSRAAIVPGEGKYTFHDMQNWAKSNLAPLEVLQYAFPSPRLPENELLRDFAKTRVDFKGEFLSEVSRLNSAIFKEFKFDAKATDSGTTTIEFLKKGRGVCQDFTHLMIGALRSLGIPVRYMSGYILTHPKKGEKRLAGADASHAWVGVYHPDQGWIDFDPTNNLIVSNQHVTATWGRDFSDVSMVRGAIRGGGEHEMDVEVTVEPLSEASDNPL